VVDGSVGDVFAAGEARLVSEGIFSRRYIRPSSSTLWQRDKSISFSLQLVGRLHQRSARQLVALPYFSAKIRRFSRSSLLREETIS
jgi:hypothetical protein